MNSLSHQAPQPIPTALPVAEQWLLASDDAQVLQGLADACSTSPEPLLAWRLRHHLIQFLCLDELPDALHAAVNSGSALVHLQADCSHRHLLQCVQDQVPRALTPMVVRHPGALANAQPEVMDQLSLPDAWVMLACEQSAPGAAPLALCLPGSGAQADPEHAQAFNAWAQRNPQALAPRLDEFEATPTAELDEQPLPSPIDWLSLGLPVVLDYAEHPNTDHAHAILAAADGKPETGTWHGEIQWCKPCDAPGDLKYTAVLWWRGKSKATATEVRLEVTLPSAQWVHWQGVHACLYPHKAEPILIDMGHARAETDHIYLATKGEVILRKTLEPGSVPPDLLDRLAKTRLSILHSTPLT